MKKQVNMCFENCKLKNVQNCNKKNVQGCVIQKIGNALAFGGRGVIFVEESKPIYYNYFGNFL